MLAPFSLYPCIDGAVQEGKMRERERYYATMTLSARAMLDRVVQGAIRSLSLVSCFETNRMRKGRKGRRRLLDRVKRSAPLSPHRKKKSGRIESEGKQERIG